MGVTGDDPDEPPPQAINIKENINKIYLYMVDSHCLFLCDFYIYSLLMNKLCTSILTSKTRGHSNLSILYPFMTDVTRIKKPALLRVFIGQLSEKLIYTNRQVRRIVNRHRFSYGIVIIHNRTHPVVGT